jgi:hypothetical protein
MAANRSIIATETYGNTPTRTGNVTWTLNLAKSGRYWLWGRVDVPNPEMDSFFVQLSADSNETPIENESWHTGQSDGWRWQSVGLNRSRQPTPFDLPGGKVRLSFRVREAGTKIDRLFLSADPGGKPE